MDKPFRPEDHDVEARLRRLEPARAAALEATLQGLGRAGEGPDMAYFLLPLAESGLDAPQMLRLARRIPEEYTLDHREIYFDFRLDRWMRILEPPTLAECLDSYVHTAPSPEEGLAYARREWEAFLKRHHAARNSADRHGAA
jgi:hypothetical protein